MKLNKTFYKQSAETLAPALLGKTLCRRLPDGKILRAVITETECYLGETDSASHASRGKTARNGIMFLRGGYLYVYLCYGLHFLANVVSGKEGCAEAVLIRGIIGHPGPGRVTKFLYIDKSLNGEDLTESKNIWLEDTGQNVEYQTMPRVGIDYALPEDREKLWRFCMVSGRDNIKQSLD